MLPVLSFILLGGRCAYCKKRISAMYLVVELVTGVLYSLLYCRFGIGFLFLKYILLFSILIVICFIDIEKQNIPDEMVVAGLLVGIIFSFLDRQNFWNYFYGALIGSGILLLIVILSKGGMGGGDVKLMAEIGFFLGWQNTILTLFSSFILGGMFAFVLLITRKKSMKDSLAFAPFLGIGALVAVFCGHYVFLYYSK
jgi:leader peptidase (prepilin peptidase)/N-methyltransferase